MLEALPQAGVLLIGRHHGSIAAFGRRLSLTRSEGGEILLNEVHAHREAARRPRPLSVVDWLRQGFGP
jgi:hypothetical protein